MKPYYPSVNTEMASVLLNALTENRVMHFSDECVRKVAKDLKELKGGLISTCTAQDQHINLYLGSRILYMQYMHHFRDALGQIERYTVALKRDTEALWVQGEASFYEMEPVQREEEVPTLDEAERKKVSSTLEVPDQEEWQEKLVSFGGMSYTYGHSVTPLKEEEAKVLRVMKIYSSLYAEPFLRSMSRESSKQKVLCKY